MTGRETLEGGPAREAERVQSMRNRAFEAGVACNVGVGVNRYVVAAGFACRAALVEAKFDSRSPPSVVGRSHRSRQGRRRPEAATAAFVTQELCRLQVGQRFAVFCVHEILRGVKNRASRSWALVLDGHVSDGRALQPVPVAAGSA